MKKAAEARSIDAYIAGFPPDVQAILREVRRVVRAAAPDAEEVISYRMPALKQDGMVIYYAGFKGHVGLFPPARGDAALEKAIKPYAGPKGNLRFPYDEPIPYKLIARVVKHRLKQNQANALAKAALKKR